MAKRPLLLTVESDLKFSKSCHSCRGWEWGEREKNNIQRAATVWKLNIILPARQIYQASMREKRANTRSFQWAENNYAISTLKTYPAREKRRTNEFIRTPQMLRRSFGVKCVINAIEIYARSVRERCRKGRKSTRIWFADSICPSKKSAWTAILKFHLIDRNLKKIPSVFPYEIINASWQMSPEISA